MPPVITSTPSTTRHADAPESPPARAFLGLSLTQVLGSALAAATSALAASFLGVAGTIIGALVGSLIATIGSAVYERSLSRAGTRLREVRPRVVTDRSKRDLLVVEAAALQTPSAARRWQPWAGLAAGVVAAAALALGGITALEGALGHPVSDSSGAGTSIGRAVEGGSIGRSGGSDTPSASQDGASEVRAPVASTPSATGVTPTQSLTSAPAVPIQATPSATATTPAASATTPSTAATTPSPSATAPASTTTAP